MTTRKTTSRKSTPAATDAQLDALWKQFEGSQASMTTAELEEISSMLFATDGVRTVRAGLVILTKSGRDLLDVIHSDTEMVGVFSELAECVKDRAERLRGVAGALDAAHMRIGLALCDAGPKAAVNAQA